MQEEEEERISVANKIIINYVLEVFKKEIKKYSKYTLKNNYALTARQALEKWGRLKLVENRIKEVRFLSLLPTS